MKANVKCSVKFKHKTTLDYKICMKDFRRYTELHFCDITLNKKNSCRYKIYQRVA